MTKNDLIDLSIDVSLLLLQSHKREHALFSLLPFLQKTALYHIVHPPPLYCTAHTLYTKNVVRCNIYATISSMNNLLCQTYYLVLVGLVKLKHRHHHNTTTTIIVFHL